MTPSQQRKHKGSILVIDDGHANLNLLFTILTEDGYAVQERSLDLGSWLRFVKDTLPDLVLVDVRKPGMDGYRVCASLKSDPTTRAIPVIFISSIDRSMHHAKAMVSGAVDYVTDPFDAEEVLWRIETHISLRRLRENLKSAVCNQGAQPVATNEDVERAFREIQILTQITRYKHAEEKVRQAAREVKKTEEALRASEQSFRLIVDGIAGLVAIMTATGEIEGVNRQVLDYFGKNIEELKGWSTSDAIHPDDRSGVISAWQRSVETASPYDTDHRLRRADGVYRWFHARGLPLRDAEGRVLRWYVLLTDIDERKQAEEKLRRSEADLQEAQRLAQLGSWKLNVLSGKVTVSPEVLRRYDVKPEEDISSAEFWFDRTHPEERTRVREHFEKCVFEKTDYDDEYRIVLPDGTIKYQHSRGRPIVDKDGNLVEFSGTTIEVTQQVQSRAALQKAFDEIAKSEDQLRAIISTIPTLVWSTDPDGSADFLNERWLEYTGLSVEQAKGWGWGAAIHPDDVKRLMDYWKSSLASGMPAETEARMRRFDGTYRWFLFRANPLRDESGNIVKWYGTNTDIDDRKRAEDQLRRSEAFLTEGQRVSSTGSFSFRVATDEVTYSEEMCRIFELQPPVSLEMIRSRIHPEDLPVFKENLERARRGDPSDIRNDLRLLLPDGSLKCIQIVAHYNRDERGQLEYIGTAQDVTQRRLSEEALSKVRSEFAHVAKVASLGMLTASIAHEINQPLSGIVTNASTCLLMLDSDPPNVDVARETAQRALRDGKRASEIITRLRALFSKKQVTTESVDLNEATREVIALSLSELQRNRVLLRTEFDSDLPIIKGDRVQLQQVILNLLRNASDAMSTVQDRPRHLLIRTEREECDGVRLTVQDAGVGFDPDTTDKLFQAFYTTKNDGAGMGLSISRSIIESHHGRLWATRNDGPGATFCFSLPRRRETASVASRGAI
jgi:PAS domain S-box-containing protein